MLACLAIRLNLILCISSLLHPIMRRRLHELQTLHQSLRADIVSGAQLFVDVRRVLPAIIDQGKLALAACRAATPSLADLQEQTRQMIKGICHVLQRIFGVHARTIQVSMIFGYIYLEHD